MRGEAAQATLEAALLLPTLMLAIALVLQPAILLYVRTVMYEAASETARAAATCEHDEHACIAYARRRLAAIPSVDIFHVGGAQSWDISVEGIGEGQVAVAIEGRSRTLPLLGVEAAAFGQVEGQEVVLRAEVSEQVRASWIEGEYESWTSIWDA